MVMPYKAQSSVRMLNDPPEVSTWRRPDVPVYQLSHSLGSRLIQQKNMASFPSVLESWPGQWESPVSTRASWREQTDSERDITPSVSFHEASAMVPQLQLFYWKSPFLSSVTGKSLGKQVFLVLALLNIPHSAYSRVYNNLTKQIAGLIKVSPWNSRRMNFHR